MQSNIPGLKAAIQQIEDEAPSLGTDKVALYDLLIKAYFYQKDLIVLLEAQQPEKEIIVDTDEIDRLSFELNEVTNKLSEATAEKDSAMSSLDKIAEIITNISEE